MSKAEIDAERINWLVKTFGEVSIGTQIDFLRWMDEQTADRDKWRDRCERLLGHYGSQQTWKYRERREWYDIYRYSADGWHFAQQIQKEIDDDY